MPLIFGGQGVTPTLRGQPSNVYALQAGEVMQIPAGGWMLELGKYSAYQVLDPITGIWRPLATGGLSGKNFHVQSYGVNHRIANQTGCAVGALITNAGTGYTSAPTVTASAGASVWQAVVGGAVNTSITVSNAGTNYVYPPQVMFAAPPSPGIQATGYSTVSGGAITSITVTNQGAGYTQAPVITLLNDPRDTTGANGTATAVLTGSGTITGLLCTDHGTPQTAVPTLAFSGGGGSSAAATAIMKWCITGITFSGGTGYTVGAGAVGFTALPMLTAGTGAYTNRATDTDLVRMRMATIYVPTTAAGAPTNTVAANILDGGEYQNVPTSIIVQNSGLYPGAATVTLAMGGLTDFCELYPV
jgi:hypothetical protein